MRLLILLFGCQSDTEDREINKHNEDVSKEKDDVHLNKMTHLLRPLKERCLNPQKVTFRDH